MLGFEHARRLLAKGRKDLRALENMMDVEAFSDEIFGFHAQQSVEKALKAWISSIGIKYPKVHDLEELLALLVENQQNVPEHFHLLIDLTNFAVEFRYEPLEELEGELNRVEVIKQVTEVVEHVEKLLREKGEAGESEKHAG